MNQLPSGRQSRGIPLLLRYLIVSVLAIVVISGTIVGSIELDRRQDTEVEVNNLYEIAEIQIAAQYNNIIGDALNVEALTKSYIEADALMTKLVKEDLQKMYQQIIDNSGKYAAIVFVKNDGTKVYAGMPKETEISEFMNNAYESGNSEDQILYAYISQFYHSSQVKEVTFTVTIPVQNSRGEIKGFLILEPYLDVIIKDVERALSNANIFYELLAVDESDAVYVYSDIDRSRGSESKTLKSIMGSDISRSVVFSGPSGNFTSDDGESYFHKFEMPVSNYYGEKHVYVSPGTYIYVLTLPTEYFNEITQMERSTLILLVVAVSVLTLLITILLYIAQNNRRKFTAKTTKMAQVDTLTGLLNRAYFTELFEKLIEEDPEAKYSILFMDLDGFKDINDSYGHNMGDKVLRVVANRLVMAARREDLVSRFGGDEFAMLISYNSVDQIRYVANKVVKAIDETMVIEENEYHVGVSVGVAIYPDHARTVDDLYKVADSAMYKVKYSTKNAYHISKGDEKID